MYQGMTLAGRYRLESMIGQGGMGQVWRGTDIRLQRPIAVKLLPVPPGTDQRTVERFQREAHITAGLQHPSITVVFDVDFHEDRLLFLVMELLDGTDLASVMEHNPQGLPLPLALSIAIQVADALETAHARGVVHRDIKPGNVILLAGGRAKLCDFGIARYSHEVTNLTGGVPVGTPAFMAPEQFESASTLDGRADLYALGGLLYVLVSGQQPFDAKSVVALMRAVLNDPPPNLRKLRPDIPPDLEQLIYGLLAKNPDDRPPNAAVVRARLRDVAARLPNATDPAPPPIPEPDPTRRIAPPSAPGVTTLHLAAWELYEQDRYDEALPIFQEAAKIRREALGPDHPDTLASRNLTAWTLYWLDREPEALPIAEDVARIRSRTLGITHPDTLDSRDLTARSLYALRRYSEALPILQSVAQARSRVLGPEHPETLSDRNLTARTLFRLARETEALPIAAAVAKGRAKVLGPDHPETLASRHLVARCLYALGRYREALPIFQEVADSRGRVLGSDHPDTELSSNFAAQTLRRLSA